MRRAIFFLLLAAAGSLPCATAAAATYAPLNGIGLVDYSRKPTFKVGDWVKYQMTGRSELGVTENYYVTLLIAGEEDFWGDPGFWIETWTDTPGKPPETQASLMSYAIFGDTSAVERLQLYMRKTVTMLNEDGTAKMDINKPAAGMLKTRREVKNPVRWTRDSLGVDTVQTPQGTFKGARILFKEGTGATQTVGDSSVYTELRENRTSWYANEVPITHLAREDIETIASRKAWLVGRSGDATALNIRDRGLGSARLIGYGHGLEARLLPERLRHSIAEQQAAERAAARPKPVASKTATRPRR
ncbi:MAG TPA: hypothetical protein VI504_06810 [Candidatus Eisenbacteria bacterium]|jgi:hypothetical protein